MRRKRRRRRKTTSSPLLGRPVKVWRFFRPPGPGSREAAAPAPTLRNFPSARTRLSSGTGPVGLPPPAASPGPRRLLLKWQVPPSARPASARARLQAAGGAGRRAGRGRGPAGHSPGRWRGARAAPSGESQPPAPAAALPPRPPQPAPPGSPLSAPGAPGSAAEPQPSQSLSGSRFQRRPGPGRRQPPPRQIPQSPDPDSRRRGRAARPGAEGGGGEAGRRVATAPGGFFPRRIL